MAGRLSDHDSGDLRAQPGALVPFDLHSIRRIAPAEAVAARVRRTGFGPRRGARLER
jgi:hypothetical protein